MTVLMGIATRLRLARLLMITDLRSDDLAGFVAATVSAGVDIVQLRDPKADAGSLAAGFAIAREHLPNRDALLGLYDALELAGEANADLLQLSERGAATGQARAGVHQWAVLGRSCHSRHQVDLALADPEVDFLTVGPVVGGLFGVGGLELVGYAAAQAPATDPASKPWFAVGGVTAENLDEVLAAGARRVAVSRAITAAENPAEAAAALKSRLIQAWNDDPGMEKVLFSALRP
jgi:thiamine-phosphate pyrophosphorylase